MTRDTINQPESKTHMAEDSTTTPAPDRLLQGYGTHPQELTAASINAAARVYQSATSAKLEAAEAIEQGLTHIKRLMEKAEHHGRTAAEVHAFFQRSDDHSLTARGVRRDYFRANVLMCRNLGQLYALATEGMPESSPTPAPAEDPKPGDIGLSPEVLADIGKPPTVTDSDSHASRVLYPAIKAAMADLAGIHEGFSMDVNRAYNRLFCAFWSEVPAPTSAGGLRNEIAPNEPPSEPTTCRASIAQHGYGPREETLDYSSTDGALLKAHSPESAAMRTLRALGYEHTGGVEWRPPYGPAPVFAEDVRAGIDCIESVLDSRADEPGERFQIVQMPLSDWRPVLAALKGKVVREPQAISIEMASQRLLAAIEEDPEFAWAWHCNLAMPIMDTLKVSSGEANAAAAALMNHLFNVNTAEHEHFKSLLGQGMQVVKPYGRTEAALSKLEELGYVYEMKGNVWSNGGDPAETAEERAAALADGSPVLLADAPLRPLIADPARRITLVLTQRRPVPDHSWWCDEIKQALLEFAEYQVKVERDLNWDHAIRQGQMAPYPYVSDNQVRIEVLPWRSVRQEDHPELVLPTAEEPGLPVLTAQEQTATPSVLADPDANMADVAGIVGERATAGPDHPIYGVHRIPRAKPVNHAEDTLAAVVDLGDTPAGTVPTAHLAGASGIGSAEASKAHGAAAFVAAHPPKHVTPTVGRVMHYIPAVGTAEAGFHPHPGGGHYAAIVADVRDHGDRVNVSVLDHLGVPHARQWVQVWREGQDTPENAFVFWPARKDGGA